MKRGIDLTAGFRRSLFGFNSEDVLNFVNNLQKEHAGKTQQLNQQIESLNQTVSTMQDENVTLQAERDGLAEQIQAFHDKFEEIERLAQNIGKLYLIAQNSSRSIMENTNESRALAQSEIDKNLDVLSETQAAIENIRIQMQEMSQRFSLEMEKLNTSLGTAKEQIAERSAESNNHADQFAAVLEMLDEQ